MIIAVLAFFPRFSWSQYYVVDYANRVTQNNKEISKGDTLYSLRNLKPRKCSNCFLVTKYDNKGKYLFMYNPLNPSPKKGFNTLGTRNSGEREEDVVASPCDTLFLTPSQNIVIEKYQIRWIQGDLSGIINNQQQASNNIIIPANLFLSHEGYIIIDVLCLIGNGDYIPLYRNMVLYISEGKIIR